MINILYATKVGIGGWATFTRHLTSLLEEYGEEVQIWKIGNNTEGFQRPFGPDHTYRNVGINDITRLVADSEPCIIAALGKHYVDQAVQLMEWGAKIVVHDTAESTNRMALDRPWVIRKCLAPLVGGVFIRHPYVRHARPAAVPKVRKGAIATSRVDFDKNTRMILDANRLGAGIKIVGFENRLYTKFKIVPDYPEWVQSPGTHPRTGGGSFEQLLGAKFMVDLTDIKGDGGGTQYTFLEAWDAGAVPVIGDWWLRKGDDMVEGRNCLATPDAAYLKRLVKGPYEEIVAKQGEAQLKKHSAKVLGPQIMEWLNG
jgi:hypothetical protein